jgi:enterochelin esterase-like enzyme
MMESGEIPEMIIVTPDGLIDAFYINNYDKSVRWEDFFHQEFIPAIEQKYRIIAERKFRAIAGLSMGGYGSLYHGIKYKDKFSAIYALSAAVLELQPVNTANATEVMNSDFFQKLLGPLNTDGFPQNFKQHSIQEMVKQMEAGSATMQAGLPAIALDCGDDDFLILQNLHLAEILKSKNFPFELRVKEGAHTWQYWRDGLPDALRFVSYSFHN